MATDNLTEQGIPDRGADDREQNAEVVVWPEITGRDSNAERLTFTVYNAMLPLPASPIDHHVLYRNLRAHAEQQFSNHYDFWEEGNKRSPIRLVVNERVTDIRADDTIAAYLITWCCSFLCAVLECHADYLLDCGHAGEEALRRFDEFASLQLRETLDHKWRRGVQSLSLRAEDNDDAFSRDAQIVITKVHDHLGRIAWRTEQERTNKEIFRSADEQRTAPAMSEVTSEPEASSPQAMNGDCITAKVPPLDDVAAAGRSDTVVPDPPRKSYSRLREARGKRSREFVAQRIRAKGIPFSADAIKKNESGTKPRPRVRSAYAAIYDVPEDVLFPESEFRG